MNYNNERIKSKAKVLEPVEVRSIRNISYNEKRTFTFTCRPNKGRLCYRLVRINREVEND